MAIAQLRPAADGRSAAGLREATEQVRKKKAGELFRAISWRRSGEGGWPGSSDCTSIGRAVDHGPDLRRWRGEELLRAAKLWWVYDLDHIASVQGGVCGLLWHARQRGQSGRLERSRPPRPGRADGGQVCTQSRQVRECDAIARAETQRAWRAGGAQHSQMGARFTNKFEPRILRCASG